MKTLPYLKQLTYVAILLTFPFIFSASKDTTPPLVVEKAVEKPMQKAAPVPTEAIKTIKVTVDSLKQTGNTLLQEI
jgi:hypothetical protein